MQTFILFGKYYLADSVKNISASKTNEAHEKINAMGGKIISIYSLLGNYDLLIIAKFNDFSATMKASVELNRLMGCSFVTSPALSIKEFDDLMG